MAESFLYQFFVTRFEDGSLISYRSRMTGLHQSQDGTTGGTAIILSSADEGATWTKDHVPVSNMPFSVDSHLITLWGPAIAMPDGRLIWGVITRARNTRETIVGVADSIDGGRSFRFVTALCDEVFDQVGEPREPGLVLLPSGELLAVIRCSPMLQVHSVDGGRTWSAPRKLVRPGICPQLLILQNGVLVCSYGTRSDMHIAISWDGSGEEWSEPLVIYEGQTSGYSNLQPLAANRFRMCYQEGTFNEFQPGGHRIVRVEIQTEAI